MKVTDQDVRYVADLANLELTEEESSRMLRDLNSILEYVDSLSRLNTDNVDRLNATVYLRNIAINRIWYYEKRLYRCN